MVTIKKDFEKQGFSILSNVYPPETVNDVYQKTLVAIKKCADELNCSLENYLTNVTRWAYPSPITKNFEELVHASLQQIASAFIGEVVKLSKINIISKSAYANAPVPCHQDIAYSRENPYEFSLWLPLQDVTLKDGVLEFLPGSHLAEIEPAVDFWQPSFIDKMYLSPYWQKNFISLPAKAGDLIAFDARIWHRSAKNESGHSRFAMVTRWSRINYHPPCKIPEKIPAKFGMWTCGALTESILQKGLLHCFQLNTISDLIGCIKQWQERLNEKASLPFLVDRIRAQNSLDDLRILHQAAELHNGGDAQGVVYANLWHYFLEPLSQWLEEAKA